MRKFQFVDRMAQGKISRRDMLKASAAFGVGVAVMKGRSAQSAEVLTCMEWSGYTDPAYFKPYEAKYGAAPNFSIFANEDEALQKVRGGFQADVMHPCTYSVPQFVEAGLSQAVDTSKLSNWKDIFPTLQTTPGVVMDGKVMMVPADWGNSSIAYRPDLVDEAYAKDESWGILFDEKYEGRVSTLDDDVSLEIAGLMLGYDRKKIFEMSDEELAATRPLAEKAVKNSRFLWKDNTEVAQGLASGEIVAAYAWNETVKSLVDQGIPAKYAIPKEGIFTWLCGLTLLNTGKADPAAAYDFLDAWISPETGKYVIEEVGYGHSNKRAFEMSDPKKYAALGIADPQKHLESGILLLPVTTERKAKYIKMWEEVKATK
ncbi:spermidine/putrescine-binding protein [Rhodoligotrophos appendicifer]|uniref:ABC transporter substrate-binding protein n=1 Tax=Rhodoligotrophos appendicifer TaxID=987056 RepID=UPI00118698EC|nr:extracellular solute-binding protein [Rhodoligotrophos appendicifer]